MFNYFILQLSNQKHLRAIQQGLLLNMPVMVIGSFAAVCINLPLNEYQNIMATLLGPQWKLLGTAIYNASFGIISLLLAGVISYLITEQQENVHPLAASATAVSCLTIFIQPESNQGFLGLPAQWLGIFGIFFSIGITVLVTELFLFFRSLKLIKIEVFFDSDDPLVAQSLANVLPFGITLLVFAIIKYITIILGVSDICKLFQDLIKSIFISDSATLGVAIKYYFTVQILWFFGMHGQNVLSSVLEEIYAVEAQTNAAIYLAGGQPTEVVTNVFINTFATMGGTGSTICLILAILLASRRGIPYRLAQISMIPALFNINEILIFGLPIALNPVFLIPFIVVPIVMLCVAYVATIAGMVPITNHVIHWTTPVLLSGYLATCSWNGVILQCVNIVIGVSIYFPFVKRFYKKKRKESESALDSLVQLSFMPKGAQEQNLINRNDKTGKMARILAHDLKEAIANKTLFLEYQPQVYQGKCVSGVEALLRWNHYSLGKIPPSLAIQLAEETGMIHSLGSWVLFAACKQLSEWKTEGIQDIVMSVNVSAMQLTKDKFLQDVLQSIAESGIKPGELEIEITESIAMESNFKTQECLRKLHKMGVKIAMDDFGMGHSSLTYIKNYPISTLKIDRALSRDLANDMHSREIVASIIAMCTSLNLKIIVEYVETKEQQEILDELGAVHCQGYLYNPSLKAEDAIRYIKFMNWGR